MLIITNYDSYYKLRRDNKNLSLQNKGIESTPQFFRFRFWLRVREVHWTFEKRAPRGLLMVFKSHEHVAKNAVWMSINQISLKHVLIERLWGCLHGGRKILYQEDPEKVDHLAPYVFCIWFILKGCVAFVPKARIFLADR